MIILSFTACAATPSWLPEPVLHKAFNLLKDNFCVCVCMCFSSLHTHHASLSTTNKRLCVCLGISITPPPPPFLPTPLLPSSLLLVFAPMPHPLPLCLCVRACTYCRLALDDAIRHERQLNISRFSPRVAGESDFLQTVINKVITAKEVNHKGQGKNAKSEEVKSLFIFWKAISWTSIKHKDFAQTFPLKKAFLGWGFVWCGRDKNTSSVPNKITVEPSFRLLH